MIVCCGEALIDMLPREIENEGTGYLPVSGGALFNTAITLGRLGEKTGFFTGLSTDLFGQQLQASLKQSNVEAGFCAWQDRPTTLAFVKLVDGHAQYAFYDENTAGRMLLKADLPDLPDDVAALHFGGISLIAEPCGAAYQDLMQREAASRVMSLDPNIRTGFISDEAAYRQRLDHMLGLADIIKVSDEDLAWLMPQSSADDATLKFLNNGTSIVLVTRGGDGVDAYSATGHFHVKAQRADVVDTVGAGDSFNGGFLAGLRRQGLLDKSALKNIAPDMLQNAIELAVQVATITVSRAGANPPWAHEL